MSKLLLNFITSIETDKMLSEALNLGYKTIFEDGISGTSDGMYSDGVANLNICNIDDGTEYVGSEQENFNAPNSELVEELSLFDLTKVTAHGDGIDLIDKFHNTETYKSIIPEMKAHADSMKLMKTHMNATSNSGIKILKA